MIIDVETMIDEPNDYVEIDIDNPRVCPICSSRVFLEKGTILPNGTKVAHSWHFWDEQMDHSQIGEYYRMASLDGLIESKYRPVYDNNL